jgi:23S rRNA pseudouridine1911/1915/1917 synthase
VCRHLNDIDAATRTRVQRWISQGLVTVNGRPVAKPSTRATVGDLVLISIPDALAPSRALPLAEDVPLEVAFEDEWLLALRKPAGVVAHPTYRHAQGTLLNAVLWRARTWPSGQRPSIVGRLDQGTSGLVLLAKTAPVHAALQRTLAARESEKHYLAVVHGRVRQRQGTIDLRLGRDPNDRRRVVASALTGVRSVTHFERLATSNGLTLLRCRILTGRMHQIRVHLSAGGWPVAGDPKYGDPARDARLAIDRMALHAWRLAFRHPMTRQPLRIEAPVPDDLAPLIVLAGGSRDTCL